MRSSYKIGLWLLFAGILILSITAVSILQEPKSTGSSSTITIDGRVKPGEYNNRYFDKRTGYKLYWRIVGNDIYFDMHSPEKGWVAVGLGATMAMQDADIYMGYVKNGKTYFSEKWGDSPYSHVPFKNLGRKSIVEKFAGSVTKDGEDIEFVRPLHARGRYVKSIMDKPMNVIFAFSGVKDFTTSHEPSSCGSVRINFFTKPKLQATSGFLHMWVKSLKTYQIAGIAWGTLFIIASIIFIINGWFIGRWIEEDHTLSMPRERIGLLPFIVVLSLSLLDLALIVVFTAELFMNVTPSARGFTVSMVFLIFAVIVILIDTTCR